VATLGNTTQSSTDSTGDYALALPIVMPAGGGTLTNISAWCQNAGANNVKMSLYSDNVGLPGTKIVGPGAVAEPTPTGAFVTGSASTSLVAGTTYWIILQNNATGGNAGGHISGIITSGTLYYAHWGGTDPPANNWNGSDDEGTSASKSLSAYITYTTGGGGGGKLFRLGNLDGIGSGGPFFANPLAYHRTPTISLEAYRREQARKHRDFLARVQRAA
jgi:hypothetical protein